MKLLLSASSLLLSSLTISSTYGQTYPKVTQRTFVDDAGITHTTRKANPKIICSARTALSLLHQFGLDGSQIAGTYGNYFPRGSIGNMNDPSYQPYWPVDPTQHELEFLKGIPTFSPSCYHAKNSKCDELDVIKAKDAAPDKWVYIGNSNWHTGSEMKEITDSMGNLPIFISTHYEADKNPGCITYNQDTATYTTNKSKCKARSLIDVIKRTNQLANFLGISKVDIAKDQRKMCDAASELSDAAASAQQRGIRVMTINPTISNDNSVTLYPVDPLADPFLRSYEELGVPIIHPEKDESGQFSTEVISSKEWFSDCQPGQMFQNCNSNAYYPVDLWLVEGRRFFFNTPEEQYFLETFFPDKALLNNQIAHWPLNDGPISYTSAARSFEEMTRKLNEAVRQYDTTQCTNTDVTSSAFLDSQFGGLKGGEYACFNKEKIQLDYLQCNIIDLAGGNQMESTYTEKKESGFQPVISNPVMAQKTISKQNKKSMWIADKNNRNNRNNRNSRNSGPSVAIIAVITVSVIIFCVFVFILVAYCVCWKNAASTTIDKSHIESIEEGTTTSITDGDEKDLPIMT